MIGVIAGSTTLEYGIRAVYGNTIGRLSWVLGGSRLTDEDRFDALAAQQYVDFIRQQPWYLFDFARAWSSSGPRCRCTAPARSGNGSGASH
ncbi:hypothetical protein [Burkholderia gladioli]|uniref:hypothetical protein n=1 Tax=Burkholderia gladioli TaxID=28095 RepID=UPI00163EB6A6|nr:hypothetical protein [Burkholderia gladioli]